MTLNFFYESANTWKGVLESAFLTSALNINGLPAKI